MTSSCSRTALCVPKKVAIVVDGFRVLIETTDGLRHNSAIINHLLVYCSDLVSFVSVFAFHNSVCLSLLSSSLKLFMVYELCVPSQFKQHTSLYNVSTYPWYASITVLLRECDLVVTLTGVSFRSNRQIFGLRPFFLAVECHEGLSRNEGSFEVSIFFVAADKIKSPMQICYQLVRQNLEPVNRLNSIWV